MHQDSSQVSSLFNPVRGVRDRMERQGIKPVDHARQNVIQVKQKSAQNRNAKEEEAVRAYEASAARLELPAQGSGTGRGKCGLRPDPLTAGSLQEAHRRAPRPAPKNVLPAVRNEGRDFVVENALNAMTAQPRRQNSGAGNKVGTTLPDWSLSLGLWLTLPRPACESTGERLPGQAGLRPDTELPDREEDRAAGR